MKKSSSTQASPVVKQQAALKSTSSTHAAVCIIPPYESWEAIQNIRVTNDKSYPVRFSLPPGQLECPTSLNGIPCSDIWCTLSQKWMPHINLLWPFVPEQLFSVASPVIEAIPAFKQLRPFRVRLQRFAYNTGSKYLHLVPEIIDPTTGEPFSTSPATVVKEKAKSAPSVVQPSPIELLAQMLSKEFPQCRGTGEGEEPEKANKSKKSGKAAGSTSPNLSPHMTIGQFPQDQIEAWRERLQSDWEPIEFDVSEISLIGRDGPNDNFSVRATIALPTL